MSLLKFGASKVQPKFAPMRPNLDQFIRSDATFLTEYFRTLGAIAASDGTVNLAEYVALHEIFVSVEQSALACLIILDSLENPTDLNKAFSRLKNASQEIEPATARSAFEAARPLLVIQGNDSRKIARNLAESLGHQTTLTELEEFPTDEHERLWNTVARHSMRLIRGKQLLRLGENCFRATGQPSIVDHIWNYEEGKITQKDLQESIVTTLQRIIEQVDTYEAQLRVAEQVQTSVNGHAASAEALFDQVSQRLANVESRIEFEKRSFAEEIDDAVHDAGDTFELEVGNRLKTDQWKLPQVWESIARTSFSKELERRIDRIVRRKEESLALLKDELRLFQVEMKLSRTSILARMHHSYFVTLMPALRPTTRVLNGTDQVADATLGIGFLSAVSAGAAIYYLGAALVMPVIAPVIPYAGGAVAVAGIFKWLTDSNKRKDNEIANKRKAFEEAFRGRLKDAETAFNKQLDELANEFRDTASAFVPPIMLEAQASERLAAVRVRVARRLIDQSRANMTTLIAEARTIEIKT